MLKGTRSSESLYHSRRLKVLRQIKGDVLVIPTGELQTRSRDQHHHFLPESNFFYLTGFSEPDAVLVLRGSSKGARTTLFIPEREPMSERFEGERLGVKRARRRLQIDEVLPISSLESEFINLVRGATTLHYPAGVNSSVDALVWELFKSPVGPRHQFPNSISDARLILSRLRFVKDKTELAALKHAVDITAHGLLKLARSMDTIKSEAHGARLLESYFSELGASGTAFDTIVASGKNATVLHHYPRLQPLWKRELVLLDAGAQYKGYAGDISRTFPKSGVFSTAQGEVYDLVLEALNAAHKKAAPGATIGQLHSTAAKVLTRGLVSLGILRGSPEKLFAKKAFQPYFMHNIGHFLGLDVHDIAPVTCESRKGIIMAKDLPFEQGTVITIEPGLYFDANDQDLPREFRGIGIRIEDDVLITNTGGEILSDAVPTTRKDIEALMASSR